MTFFLSKLIYSNEFDGWLSVSINMCATSMLCSPYNLNGARLLKWKSIECKQFNEYIDLIELKIIEIVSANLNMFID